MKRFVLREKEVEFCKKLAINQGFTHIKIELEGELNRSDSRREECDDCYGHGVVTCEYCDDGAIELDSETENGEPEYATCEYCDGSAEVTCDTCNGNGYYYGSDYSDESECEEYIKNYVSYDAQQALTYGTFYEDGSVDSEFTFTLPVEKLEYAVEYIEAFNALAQEVGNGLEVGNAGMHIAMMSSGDYPNGCELNHQKVRNFKRSVEKLMPALFFLSTANDMSRRLYFRMPQVSTEKYSAINYGSGVLEYRLFETCYDKPEMIFDFFIVIAKTLKFYSTEYIQPNVKFKGAFGFIDNDSRGKVDRFFFKSEHIDLLEETLREIRPTYKTMQQLKDERGFTKSKKELRENTRREIQRLKDEYKQNLQYRRRNHRYLNYYAKARWYDMLQNSSEEDVCRYYNVSSLKEYVEQYINEHSNYSTSLRNYIENRINNTGNLCRVIEY